MRAGIVGLPRAGKTTIFHVLIRAKAKTSASGGPGEESHVGIVRVPDARLDSLAAIFKRKKTTYATMELVDVQGGVLGKSKDVVLAPLRTVEALVHVVRTFRDESVPHPAGTVDPDRDMRTLDFELMLADLASIEKRLERLEKDLKKVKNPALSKEQVFLERAHQWLESERPLREMEMTEEERHMVRGFAFLSEKPMIYVLNVGEDQIERVKTPSAGRSVRPNTETTAICGKLEAEMAELSPNELREFLANYGLTESGSERLIRATYHLLGLISFFTVNDEECRAWTITRGTSAHRAAGVIHTDIEQHFIRAEVVHFDDFKGAGDMRVVREKGLLRLEGKEYRVKDGDIVQFRHSG